MTITLSTVQTVIVCFIWMLVIMSCRHKDKPFYKVCGKAILAGVLIYFPLICICFLNFIGVDW